MGDSDISAETKRIFPTSYIRYSLKEARDRMKLLEQMCGFIEDQSDIENRFGLALQKSHNTTLSTRSDWLPVVTASYEGIIKSSTSLGKQHVNHSVVVSSNATKVFPEIIKNFSKKLYSMATKVFATIYIYIYTL